MNINKVLYLGPLGSYSELAKMNFVKYFTADCEFLPMDSIYKIVRSLKEFNAEDIAAILPIENSIEGVVRETQDSLVYLAEKGIKIFAETVLRVEHALISYGDISQIKTISSHPQALAQCREYIYDKWQDNVSLAPVLSTSSAVMSLSPDLPTMAAIGSEYCAKLYNVPVIQNNINDENNNTTRFVLLNKLQPEKTDFNKVSLIFSTENKAGALNKVLSIFEKFNLNMLYIDSRPSRRELGEYVFYVDFAGHINDFEVTAALEEVRPFVKFFQILSEGALSV